MARTGRPKDTVNLIRTEVRLKPETSSMLTLLCTDPFTGKIKYGLRNETIETALQEYFERNYPERGKEG